MPFHGVRYYSVIDPQAVDEGRYRIGAVGWRLDRTSVATVAKFSDRTLTEGTGLEMEMLGKIDIFKNMNAAQVQRVVDLGQKVSRREGQLLGEAGELISHLFLIIEGSAELSARSGIGPITVRVATMGESFPLAVLIGSGSLITSAVAMTDMKLLAIPRSRILALFSRDTEIAFRVYSAIAEVLGDRYSKTLERLTANTDQVLKKAGYFVNV